MRHVLQYMQEGGTVVTVNRRLARFFTEVYDRWQWDRGLKTWPTPDLLPYEGWLVRCWDALTLSTPPDDLPSWPVLLSLPQEQALWEKVIQDEKPGGGLLDMTSVVDKVMQAYALWCAWSDPDEVTDAEAMFYDGDERAFQTWMLAFETHCRLRGWISAARIPTWLMRFARHLEVDRPHFLVGFDRLSPIQKRLQSAFRLTKLELSHQPITGQSRQHVCVGFPDQETEIAAAACWAAHRLRENPSERIGVVVPELHRIRDQVARLFADFLHPETLEMTCRHDDPFFNMSLGSPLLGYPLIQDMFLLLEGLRGTWRHADVGALLRSPGWAGGESERSSRALLDRWLREQGRSHISLQQLHQYSAKKTGGVSCPLLHNILTRIVTTQLPSGDRTPGQWGDIFFRWFAAWGWPGERPLTSREQQTCAAGRDLLQTFATLEGVVGKIPLFDALRRLRGMARQQLYQPETPDAPVQILGILESVGEPFSALWLLGISRDVWPSAPSPNPFLPLSWQRRKGLPRASAQGELEFAQHATERLLASSPVVVASYPLLLEGLKQHASPLIAELAPTTIAALGLETSPYHWQRICDAAIWETYVDHHGVGLDVKTKMAGGARILKSQAECPFKAFAVFRLGAAPFPEVEPVIDSRIRGNLVHRLLEQFWRVTPSLKSLAELGSETLHERIHQAVVAAVQGEALLRPELFPPGLRRLEEGRLTRLLTTWIQLERTRSKPFQVVSQEQPIQMNVGGLPMELRPDRVDKLDDGRHVVLDYKTGDPKLGDWHVPRIREPQLPLYCLFQKESVAAVAFARVKPDKPDFIGLGEEEDLLPLRQSVESALQKNNLPAWPELLNAWRDDLTATAMEFLAGKASVSPLPGACDHCSLTPLCRKHAIDTLQNPLAMDEEL
ncbi:MAG: PD-(D/E)XK nuclease family protein [Magnetococcales bacterium]|nr:PD-(D/E)XK nuclease family protein [Magnetococcales bacterium]